MNNNQQEIIQASKNTTPPPASSGFASAALTLGIVGISTSFLPFINCASFILGILAVIFGSMALNKNVSLKKPITSIILGGLSIIISLTVLSAMTITLISTIQSKASPSWEDDSPSWEDDVEISLGSFEVTEGDYFSDTKVTVSVKNISDKRRSFSIKVEAIDEEGYRLDTDYIYVNDLGAGQGQKVDIFTYVPEEDIDEMKKASFRVIDVSVY